MSRLSLFKSEKGTSLAILAVLLSALLGLSAFVIDIGMMVYDKSRLSATMDAAALAGAQELISDGTNVDSVVMEYINKNLSDVINIEIDWSASDRTVEVSGSRKAASFFSQIFNESMGEISAIAKAKVEVLSSLRGVRPLAVVQQDFEYGRQYTLKVGAGDGSSGNYGAIALGGSGSSNYLNNLLYGYGEPVSVNDLIETETGNMAGNTRTGIHQLIHSCTHTPPCTYDNYNRTCPRIIFLPVVNTLQVSGRDYVRVLGFATFFLEGIEGSGGQADVIGRFITYSAAGETASNINDYGTYGIRLVK